jgi:hypothetical protein
MNDRSDKENGDVMLHEILHNIEEAHISGRHPPIYTGRTELNFDTFEERLIFGETISAF